MQSNLLQPIVDEFETISLAEMQSVEPSDRQDIKYLLNAALLPRLLTDLRPIYKVFSIDSQSQFDYHNQYFDTEDFRLYRLHHNRNYPRIKVRYRSYTNSGDCYIEVKWKNNKKRTKKSRQLVDDFSYPFPATTKQFIVEHSNIISEELFPSLEVDFMRITLVNLVTSTKITIDYDIVFTGNGNESKLDHVAVAELKQFRYNPKSPFIRLMRESGILPRRFSKYCMGMVKVRDDLKYNRFKPNLMFLDKLSASLNDKQYQEINNRR